MQIRFFMLLVAIATSTTNQAFAAQPPQLYADAAAIWTQIRDDKKYQAYAAEFSDFNNHFHLDEKNACYLLGPESVNLMLVIKSSVKGNFAVIDHVFSDIDSAKARCFIKSYEGVSTKMPPFLPFVLQMEMR